jgi:hypothetical protein
VNTFDNSVAATTDQPSHGADPMGIPGEPRAASRLVSDDGGDGVAFGDVRPCEHTSKRVARMSSVWSLAQIFQQPTKNGLSRSRCGSIVIDGRN